MPYVQTENPRIYRDTDSRGLVVTDRATLLKARAERGAAKRMSQIMTHREEFDSRISVLSQRLDRCEALLQELLHHVTALVSRAVPETSESRE